MRSKNPSVLSNVINSLGMSTREFASNILGLNYQTYLYRIRKGVLRVTDYHKILKATGRTWEELFGESAKGRVILPPIPKEFQQARAEERKEEAVVPPPVQPIKPEQPEKDDDFVIEDIPIV